MPHQGFDRQVSSGDRPLKGGTPQELLQAGRTDNQAPPADTTYTGNELTGPPHLRQAGQHGEHRWRCIERAGSWDLHGA